MADFRFNRRHIRFYDDSFDERSRSLIQVLVGNDRQDNIAFKEIIIAHQQHYFSSIEPKSVNIGKIT
jgi:hypothetical protein